MSTGFVAFLLYLLVMVDNFRTVAGSAIGISIAGLVGLVLACGAAADFGDRPFMKQWPERIAAVFLVLTLSFSTLIVTLVPNRDGAVLIVAGALGYEGVTRVIESERVQAVGGKSVALLETWLDQQIEEINAERSEELNDEDSQPQGETNG